MPTRRLASHTERAAARKATLFVLGGARSGKSRFALSEQQRHTKVVFVATAEATDADMATRIARHQRERPACWRTLEEPLRLVDRLSDLADVDAVVVDCLTVWVANLMARGDSDEAIHHDVSRLGALIEAARYPLTLVSNEVGEGVHPETALGLRFRDLLGSVNQTVASACDRVVLMVAGVPLTVKGSRVSHGLPA